jgi:predicted dienelactone hydrolase
MGRSRILLIPLTLIIVLSIVRPVPAQEPPPLILAEYGPHGVGTTSMTFVDSSRQDHEVRVDIWYPAIIPEGETYIPGGLSDAEPERRDAPYPLVLASHPFPFTSSGWGSSTYGDRAGHLASHGFVVAAPDHRDRPPIWWNLADRPLDTLFVLNQLAEHPGDHLRGVINTDQVGVWGGSLGGYTAITLNGAWIDLPYLAEWCATGRGNESFDPCGITDHWDEFAQFHAEVNLGTDAPWPSFGDERIRAVVAVVPWGGPVFGADGLAAATVPTLLIGAVQDRDAPYARDAVFMYNHLGSEEHYLISLIGASHGSVFHGSLREYVFHFTTAYFGYHLSGQEAYASYLTADFVEQFDDLAWGPVETQEE